MRRFLLRFGLLAVGAYALGEWFRRHPRTGTRFMNETVGPWLLRSGIVGQSRGEVATLEHVGRHSGTVRRTLVHPMPIPGGIRMIVPVGTHCEWAKNVLAAGHCRMQIGDRVLELDEPLLELPSEVPGLPAPARAIFEWLGFRYLRLHTFSETPGQLEAPEATAEAVGVAAAPEPEPAVEVQPAAAGD